MLFDGPEVGQRPGRRNQGSVSRLPRRDAERLEQYKEHETIVRACLATEAKEGKKNEGQYRIRPSVDLQRYPSRPIATDLPVDVGNSVNAAEVVVGVCPGDPRGNSIVDDIEDEDKHGVRKSDKKLRAGQRHEPKIGVGGKPRVGRAQQLGEVPAALEEHPEGSHAVAHRDT